MQTQVNLRYIPSESLELNYQRYHPYFYRLREVNWAIFGSLTWEKETCRKDVPGSEWQRRYDFNGLIYSGMREFDIRGRSFAYYRAMEYGKGECHYHFLIAKDGIEKIPVVEFARYLENSWQRTLQLGRADVRPYDKSLELAGVIYCLKREFNEFAEERERSDYISGGLKRLLAKQKGNNLLISHSA